MTAGTLVYLFKENRILLAMKKRGFGEGKWNGPGGKILGHETPKEAAIREVMEEIGIAIEILGFADHARRGAFPAFRAGLDQRPDALLGRSILIGEILDQAQPFTIPVALDPHHELSAHFAQNILKLTMGGQLAVKEFFQLKRAAGQGRVVERGASGAGRQQRQGANGQQAGGGKAEP